MKKFLVSFLILVVLSSQALAASEAYCKVHTKVFVDIFVCLKQFTEGKFLTTSSYFDKLLLMQTCVNVSVEKHQAELKIVGTDINMIKQYYISKTDDMFHIYNEMAINGFSKGVVSKNVKDFYIGCRRGY